MKSQNSLSTWNFLLIHLLPYPASRCLCGHVTGDGVKLFSLLSDANEGVKKFKKIHFSPSFLRLMNHS